MPRTIKESSWKGRRDPIEVSGSPEWLTDEKGTRITRRYEGPADIIRIKYDGMRRGQTMKDLGDGHNKYPIKSFRYTPADGGSAQLTVQLDDYTGPDEAFISGKEGEPTYEEEWMELERHVSKHPRFVQILAADEIAQIVSAAEAGEPLPSGFEGAEEEATSLYERIKAGQDGYTVYYPVIRATTPYSKRPPSGPVGRIEDPPKAADAPEGWQYRKTAHRRMKPGQESRYDLVEEWTGAELWDPFLYGADSGLPGTD